MSFRREDSILKVMIIVFLVIVLGNALEYIFVNRNNLKRITGKVSEVIIKTYECRGLGYYNETCEKTVIKLENYKGSFRVSDYLNRGAYINEIEKGDEVTIYIRKWYQYILSLGSGKDMYGLEKAGISYYDIERWKASNKAFMLIFGFLSIIFGGLYILQRVTIK